MGVVETGDGSWTKVLVQVMSGRTTTSVPLWESTFNFRQKATMMMTMMMMNDVLLGPPLPVAANAKQEGSKVQRLFE